MWRWCSSFAVRVARRAAWRPDQSTSLVLWRRSRRAWRAARWCTCVVCGRTHFRGGLGLSKGASAWAVWRVHGLLPRGPATRARGTTRRERAGPAGIAHRNARARRIVAYTRRKRNDCYGWICASHSQCSADLCPKLYIHLRPQRSSTYRTLEKHIRRSLRAPPAAPPSRFARRPLLRIEPRELRRIEGKIEEREILGEVRR